MAMVKKGKVVHSGASRGAAGTHYNPGGVGRSAASQPIYQGARTPGAAGTMSNPGSVGRTVGARGSSGVGAATGSYGRMPGTTAGSTSAGRSAASAGITKRTARKPIDPGSIGVAGKSRTHVPGAGGVTTKVEMGPTRGGAIKAARDLDEKVIETVGKKSKNMLHGKGLMIGAGAAVIAGLAMNRRGDGTSSGRSSMARY